MSDHYRSKPITQEMVDKYRKNASCPECGHEGCSISDFEMKDGSQVAYHSVVCGKCFAKWREIWACVGFDSLKVTTLASVLFIGDEVKNE
jgi:transcription elongation factor Elf1